MSPLTRAPKMASGGIWALLRHPIQHFFSILYILIQKVLNFVFVPSPPPPTSNGQRRGHPRIAVVGTGLTGVSSAAHCIGHGVDVKLFEARSQDEGLGGIWSV